MLYEEEKALVLQCLDGLIRLSGWQDPLAKTLCEWMKVYQHFLGIDISAFLKSGNDDPRPKDKAAWSALAGNLSARLREERKKPAGPVSRNIEALGAGLGLDATEQALFNAVCWYEFCGKFYSLVDKTLETRFVDSNSLLAATLKLPMTDLWQVTGPKGPVGKGLIEFYNTAPNRFPFEVSHSILRALLPPQDGLADIESALFGDKRTPELTWSDFDHIATQRDFIGDLVKSALSSKEKGINILLYGRPGSGKTELCHTLAAQIGSALYGVGEADDDGDEPSRWERLTSLRLAQALIGKRANTLVLVDEMEDLIADGTSYSGQGRSFRRAGSKVYFNRLLETNPVPILWTSNDIDCFDPAFLRRMTFILEMPEPATGQRRALWTKLLEKEDISLPANVIDNLARRHAVTPGTVAGSIRAAKLADSNGARLGIALDAMDRALNKGHASVTDQTTHTPPDLGLVNADTDIVSLAHQLARPGAPRDFSLCLYGPPGTGKSALVRLIAEELGLEVVQKRASDLISKWVGESEANIAQAFRQAEQDRHFLVFDEADSLLDDRSSASRGWEVSQVNEMLTWMERHPFPFACTTNLMERLDKAALRRFTFKIKLGYLTPAQIARAFDRFFGQAAPEETLRLANLAPGDFAVVQNRLRFLTDTPTPTQISTMLHQECAVKPGHSARIGF
jgi:transitional endoplasmic reticulum ATPase